MTQTGSHLLSFLITHMGSRLESQVGSRQSHPRSQLHSRQNPTWNLASNPRWDPSNPTRDPSFVPCKIPPIPPSNLFFPGGIPPIPPGIPNLYHVRSRVGSHNLTWGSLVCDPNRIPFIEFFNNPQIPVPALERV